MAVVLVQVLRLAELEGRVAEVVVMYTWVVLELQIKDMLEDPDLVPLTLTVDVEAVAPVQQPLTVVPTPEQQAELE
jgi:hypothetical protein